MCDFTGKFSNPKKINDYTYSVQIENIEQERETDTEEITEGLRTIYSKPYGLDGAKDVLIYLPGSPLKELPEEFLDWVYHNDEERKKTLYYRFMVSIMWHLKMGFQAMTAITHNIESYKFKKTP